MESAALNGTQAALNALIYELEQRSVEYCLMRAPGKGASYLFSGRDIDILLSSRHIAPFISAVRKALSGAGFHTIRCVPRVRGFVLVGQAPTGVCGEEADLKLDVHLYARFRSTRHRRIRGGTRKVAVGEIETELCQYEPGRAVRVPSAIDSFLILCNDWMLGRRKRPEYYESLQRRLRVLLSCDEVRSWVEQTLGSDGPCRLLRLLEPACQFYRRESVVLLRRMVDARYGRERLLKWGMRQFAVLSRALVMRLKPAPLLYFSGPDGAGKTTLSLTLADHLTVAYMENSRRIHVMQTLVPALIRALAWIREHATIGKARVDGVLACGADDEMGSTERLPAKRRDRDTGRRSWRVRRYLGMLVGVADVMMTWLRLCYLRVRGVWVLVDIAPLEIFVKRHRPFFRRSALLFSCIMPAPTQGYVLVASAAAILRRKPELTETEINQYYATLDWLIGRTRASDRYIHVRTDTDRAHTRTEVEECVRSTYWAYMMRKCRAGRLMQRLL